MCVRERERRIWLSIFLTFFLFSFLDYFNSNISFWVKACSEWHRERERERGVCPNGAARCPHAVKTSSRSIVESDVTGVSWGFSVKISSFVGPILLPRRIRSKRPLFFLPPLPIKSLLIPKYFIEMVTNVFLFLDSIIRILWHRWLGYY